MKFAFVFPGQGSQSVGMLADYAAHPVVRATFDEASDVLGQDLWALVEEGPAEALNQTVNTQPVMLTAGVAVWRAWLAAGGARPALVAGHSLGEYTALVAAGALDVRATRCRWCASARRRCRTRCRPVSARWPRSSASTTPAWRRRAPRRRRGRWSSRSTSTRRTRS